MRVGLLHRLKWISGIVLMGYCTAHLLNHSLGIHSIALADSVRERVMTLLHHPLLAWLTPAALLSHVVLSMQSILRRRTLEGWKTEDIVQVIFGLAIPLILIGHLLATWYARTFYDYQPSYAHYWAHEGLPMMALMTIMLITVWVHGCLGIHMGMRFVPLYQRYFTLIYAGALLLPACSLIGVASMWKEGLRLREDPEWMAAIQGSSPAMDYEGMSRLVDSSAVPLTTGFMVLIGIVLAFWGLRAMRQRRERSATVTYTLGRQVSVTPGTSLLEASRLGELPHAAVCGGRGRCSTCKIWVRQGAESLSPAQEEEQLLLSKIQAPPEVRLGCQARVLGDCTVHLMVKARGHSQQHSELLMGEERRVTVMFADLRGFTRMSDGRLPYDIVFLLNQYFQIMGQEIEAHEGTLDKFIGDGIMALFGLKTDTDGAREALEASLAMQRALKEMNESLEGELELPLRIGVGLHTGEAVVGEMGYGEATQFTAIGDTVNKASRLESTTKELGVFLALSVTTAESSGLDWSDQEPQQVLLRGAQEPMMVYGMQGSEQLESLLRAQR